MKPYVRPDVQKFIDAQNARPKTIGTADILPQIRAMSAQAMTMLDAPIGELALMRDHRVPGATGDLAARFFDARAQREPGPVVVYIHGGGFSNLGIDTHTSLTAEIARQLDLPVVSISYRLAPENPWPAAPDDVVSAIGWIAENAQVFDREFTGLVLAGDSAGGNLAAVAATTFRDAPAALPVLAQLLLYPKLDWRGAYPSAQDFSDGYGLSAENIQLHDEHYAADANDWRASPIVAELAGLPATIVVTASLDPLRDEGRAYAARCAEAGVITYFWEALGQVHGFATFRQIVPSAVTDLRKALILTGIAVRIETS